MGRKRRSFSAEFKAEAVSLCRVGDRSIKQVAKDLSAIDGAITGTKHSAPFERSSTSPRPVHLRQFSRHSAAS